MLIIVEGPDGVGKTTFVELLNDLIPKHVMMYHAGPPTRPPLFEYELALQWYEPGSGLHVICDRWHWGERVYGPLLRGRDAFTQPEWLHVEKFLEAKGAIVVLLEANPAVLEDRIRRRGDKLITPEMAGSLALDYMTVDQISVLTRYRYVVDDSFPDGDDAAFIIGEAETAELEVHHLPTYKTYVGPPKPKYLLCGDVRGFPQRRPPEAFNAAFVPQQSTSGKYLLESLEAEVAIECGIVNACETADPLALWNDLGNPAVCALGRNADRRLIEFGVPHGHVPHPQYWRRFHHRKRLAYGELITMALLDSKALG